MEYELGKYFEEIARTIPTAEEQNFVFTENTFGPPPAEIATDRLRIKKLQHQYAYSFAVDMLDFQADKKTYRDLGLLILSVIFHPEPFTAILKLTNPAPEIKNVLIENSRIPLDDLPPGYFDRPYGFAYWPSEMPKHPFGSHFTPRDLPCFGLTNLDDFVVTDEHLKSRDTVRIFGSDEGNVMFAELLLNAGRPESSDDEYVLECESGNRGVGISSAEVRLILPGHLFWDDA